MTGTDGGGGWGEGEIETLKTMWADGYSASQVARALGGGRTRSAVMGKVHRMGLPQRACDARRGAHTKTATPRSIIRDRVVHLSPRQHSLELRRHPEPEAARLPDGSLIGTADLTSRHCRWPHGDVVAPDFHYCGQAPKAGSSWCEHHAVRASASMQPPSPEQGAMGRQAERQFAKMWG